MLGEPDVSDGFAFSGFSPGVIGKTIQAGDKVAGEDGVVFLEGKGEENVEEEGADGAGVVGLGGEAEGSVAGELGPGTAGDVGEGEERFPDIGGTVVEVAGEVGASVGDSLGMITDEG